MKYFFLSLALPCFAAATCLSLMRDEGEIDTLRSRPGHVKRWNAIAGKFDSLEALTSNRSAFCSVSAARSLRGRTLVVAVDPTYPYVVEVTDSVPGDARITGVKGFIGDIWTALEEALKFKTIYRRATRGHVETLMNGNTHALLVAAALYSYTSSYYAYSVPFTTSSYALFLQSDGERVPASWYVGTFSRGLWLTSFAFVVCVACSITGMYRAKRLVSVSREECDDEFSSPSFNLLHVLGGISGQGFQKIPRSWSLRLIILSCLLMGMLLSCVFSSTLISGLANRGSSVSLNNLEDLMAKRTHSLCVRNDSSAYVYFTANNTMAGDIKDEWKELVNNDCPDIKDSETLASQLCRPGLAYLEAPSIFLPTYHGIRRNCNIVQLPEIYWDRQLAFLHARSSQYRHLIDIYLMRMRSAGIFTYLERKWISMEIYSHSNDFPQNAFQPVKYEHVHQAFLEFTVMAIISATICILENVWYKLQLKFRKINTDLTLLAGNNHSSVKRPSRKAGSSLARRRKIHSMLLLSDMKNPTFLRTCVTIRVNHW